MSRSDEQALRFWADVFGLGIEAIDAPGRAGRWQLLDAAEDGEPIGAPYDSNQDAYAHVLDPLYRRGTFVTSRPTQN